MEIIDLGFEIGYRIGDHFPENESIREYYFYHNKESAPKLYGFNLCVSTSSSKWFGFFVKGISEFTEVFATPSKDIVCVVVGGQGYWINVQEPEKYEVIPMHPILKVIKVPEKNIMIFVDFICISAYGSSGRLWATPRISWDGIDIKEVTPTAITGLAWDAPNQTETFFEINIADGEVKGGVKPDLVFDESFRQYAARMIRYHPFLLWLRRKHFIS